MDKAEQQRVSDTIASACRLLAYLGLVRETTGHISARYDDNRMLIRCRGKNEAGLAFTEPGAVRVCNLDGKNLEGAPDYETPTELPIHAEVYRARPDVKAVVHAHAPASMMCGIAGLELKPIFGSFDLNASRLAVVGIPIYPSSALIRAREAGQEMAACLADKSVCLLQGHGIVAVGRSVEEATLNAIRLETLAEFTLDLARTGAKPKPISDSDLAYFKKLEQARDARNEGHERDVATWVWRHYMKLLERHEGGAPRF